MIKKTLEFGKDKIPYYEFDGFIRTRTYIYLSTKRGTIPCDLQLISRFDRMGYNLISYSTFNMIFKKRKGED